MPKYDEKGLCLTCRCYGHACNCEQTEKATAELRAEVDQLKRELDQCAGWFKQIRLRWARWEDLRTISGAPSTTQQVDAWLEARAAALPTPELSGNQVPNG